ncbi:molybdenum cofactor guanylyltransferase [Brevibacterium yomogidense]|uniref:molybdenum cofactor guanylyltransferase n=1 Tax=Brevibacterium yomogidense TaxID=946573 RepID=UPI0018DFC43A|nr:NTP transferase domain-containing protein [Brevibacterium yomogidense]
MSSLSTVRALVLTGGRSRRFGGVHKPSIPVGGTPVLTRVHAALAAVPVDGVWISGPLDGLAEGLRGGVRQVFERPRYSGPLAGIAAAVADMPEDPQAVVLVLAGDVPYTDATDLALLARTCASTGNAVSCADDEGRLQNLCAAWPDPLLRARLAAIGDPADTAVRRLWEGVEPALVPVSVRSVEDFDTVEDYRRITGEAPPRCPRADPGCGGGAG